MTIEVGSATDWERLIAEGDVEQKIGFIVSDEDEGTFHVSLFMLPRDDDDFAFSRKQAFRTVHLDGLLTALSEARDRLRQL